MQAYAACRCQSLRLRGCGRDSPGRCGIRRCCAAILCSSPARRGPPWTSASSCSGATCRPFTWHRRQFVYLHNKHISGCSIARTTKHSANPLSTGARRSQSACCSSRGRRAARGAPPSCLTLTATSLRPCLRCHLELLCLCLLVESRFDNLVHDRAPWRRHRILGAARVGTLPCWL
jgi:hypothetical protein